MSDISCDCWTAQSRIERSRLRTFCQFGLLLCVLVILWLQPLALWAKLVALVILPVVAWFEWRSAVPVVALAHHPGEWIVTLRDGSRWRAGSSATAVCYPLWLSMRVECQGRRRWITLFRDQLPAHHWRRVRVLLRWG